MIESIAQKGEQVKGFYSPAKKIDLGNCYLIFVSGIQASKTDADISGQTHEVFDVIGSILENASATFDDVVKAVIYVTDMKDFEVVSQIRQNYFINSKPASTLVEVKRMVNDGAKIEIEVTAILKK